MAVSAVGPQLGPRVPLLGLSRDTRTMRWVLGALCPDSGEL